MAIPTIYQGIEYRSRLEARWAAFFDLIGWQYTYEPLDGHGYIPDFLIHGDAPLLVEVKPASTLDNYQAPIGKITRGLVGLTDLDILIVGVDPLPAIESFSTTAGLLGEHRFDGTRDFAPGAWFTCRACGATGIFHTVGSYHGRPCGHYDGDGLLGPASRSRIKSAWAQATNRVKWHGRAA